MSFVENEIGFEFRTAKFLVFFGKKNSSRENLQVAYPHLHFKGLHQVHGNVLLETNSQSPEDRQADAHWTTDKNVALLCKTADCIPVLAVDTNNQHVLSAHADGGAFKIVSFLRLFNLYTLSGMYLLVLTFFRSHSIFKRTVWTFSKPARHFLRKIGFTMAEPI